MNKKNPVSVCIITKNEEEKMPACLESVKWAAEIIVVDDFSIDKTFPICQTFQNVKYVTRKFDGFGYQKNYAVSLASHDWVLNIDADEVVTEELRDEIIRTIESRPSYAGFRVRRKNLWFGIYEIDSYPGALRLFRKDLGNFGKNYVHESVEIKGPIGQLKGFLLHHPESYKNFRNHYNTYVIKYGKLAAHDYYKRGRRITLWNAAWRIIFLPISIFLWTYFIKKNFLRGKTGFLRCLCIALNYHKAYWYLWKWRNGFEIG